MREKVTNRVYSYLGKYLGCVNSFASVSGVDSGK